MISFGKAEIEFEGERNEFMEFNAFSGTLYIY